MHTFSRRIWQAKFVISPLQICLQFTEEGLTTFALPPHSRRSRFFFVATRHNPKARVQTLIGVFHAAHLTERGFLRGAEIICGVGSCKSYAVPRGLASSFKGYNTCTQPDGHHSNHHNRARPTLSSQPMPFLSGRHC